MPKQRVRHVFAVIVLVSIVISACSFQAAELGTKEDALLDVATEDASITMGNDNGESEDEARDDEEYCASAKFRIDVNHVFNWSPGRITDQFLVNGETLTTVCYIGSGTTAEKPGICKISYSNDGFIQTDAGECELSGQSQALLEVVASCSDGNHVLEITEYQNPDADLGAELDCPAVQMTEPHPTYYPGTISEFSFPTSQKTYMASEPGPDVSGSFEYQKTWEITVISEAPCEDIMALQEYAEDAQKRMELYDEFGEIATSVKELDRMVQEAMDEYYRSKMKSGLIESVGDPQSAAHYDACGAAVVNNTFYCANGQIDEPLCGWLDEGLRAHENQHQRDALANHWDTTTYCKRNGSDAAQVASRWEVNAYGEQLRVYNEILDTLRDLFPECFE
jgi:hypothetical protein